MPTAASPLLIASLATLAVGCARASDVVPAIPETLGQASSPDEALSRLREHTRGKVTLLTFWATWCTACEAEIPALRRLADRAPAHGGEVVGVAVGESEANVRIFARRHAVGYRQLLDEDFQLLDALGGERRIPRTLVLDASGRIVYRGLAFDPHALAAFREALAR